MYFIYLDESGSTGQKNNDENQPYFVLGSLLIYKEIWQAVNYDFEKILETYFDTNIEIYAKDIWQGKGYFKNIDKVTKNNIILDILDLPVKYDLPIFIEYVDKKKFLDNYNANDIFNPYSISLVSLASVVDRFLMEKKKTYGMFICDRIHQHEASLKAMLNIGQNSGPKFSIKRILETIHFVDSSSSYFIQIIDTIIYFYSRKLNKRSIDSKILNKFETLNLNDKELNCNKKEMPNDMKGTDE